MLFSITTSIKGDRSVFGHSSEGTAGGGGVTDVYDALDVALAMKDEHDWAYLSWSGDTMILEFDSKHGPDQHSQKMILSPENLYEFTLLKDWERNNGFLVQGSN